MGEGHVNLYVYPLGLVDPEICELKYDVKDSVYLLKQNTIYTDFNWNTCGKVPSIRGRTDLSLPSEFSTPHVHDYVVFTRSGIGAAFGSSWIQQYVVVQDEYQLDAQKIRVWRQSDCLCFLSGNLLLALPCSEFDDPLLLFYRLTKYWPVPPPKRWFDLVVPETGGFGIDADPLHPAAFWKSEHEWLGIQAHIRAVYGEQDSITCAVRSVIYPPDQVLHDLSHVIEGFSLDESTLISPNAGVFVRAQTVARGREDEDYAEDPGIMLPMPDGLGLVHNLANYHIDDVGMEGEDNVQ